jgi:hypothetical protein
MLKIDPSARSAALGSAGAAAPGDGWSLFNNPAALTDAAGRQVMMTHAAWLDGDTFQSAGVVLPGKSWAAGAGLLRLSHGEMEGRDASRRPTGGFSAEDQALVASFSRRWGGLGAGASAKLLRERIGGESASGWAMDAGVRLAPAGSALSWGASLQNMKTGGKGPQAGSAALGAAFKSPGLGLISVDVVRSLDGGSTEVRAGLERWVMNALALRAGYVPSFQGGAPAWRTGLGLKRGAFQLDYALVPVGALGVTQRMSMSVRF